MTENVEHYRETGVREGEAQNTTFLNVSFRVSSVPDFLDDGSRQFRIIRFVELKEAFQTFMNGPKMWNGGISFKKKCRRAAAKTKSAISHNFR